jgi:hypothetical protein
VTLPQRALSSPPERLGVILFPASLALLLGIGLLRFGNPVVLDDPALVLNTQSSLGYKLESSHLRYYLLALVVLASLPVARYRTRVPRWVLLLPALWMAAQILAALTTVDVRLSIAVLKHFAGCCICFYLGLLALYNVHRLRLLWLGIALGFAGVLATGFDQHFGGLEETRRYFLIYEMPKLTTVDPEMLKRIHSTRIFSTFVYPNALACCILLFLPLVLAASQELPRSGRWLASGAFLLAGSACMVWTGSKAGWIIALIQIAVWIVTRRIPLGWKVGIVAAIGLVGLTSFAVKYRDYFARGATSVSARFDYWEAAWQTIRNHPGLGTGPGTFGFVYARIKPPEAEMARLAHNDYLQQWSDSGISGFLSYLALILGSIWQLFRSSYRCSQTFLVWLGLLGFALHSLVDFGLYIPVLAWSAFLFMGWLWAKSDHGIESTASSAGITLEHGHESTLP